MKSPLSLVALMVSVVLLAFTVYFSMRVLWGKRDVENPTKKGLEIFSKGREIDRQARSRLEELGLRFDEATRNAEPALDVDNPSDADFAFLEDMLRTNDDKARVSAAKVLRDIGSARGVPPLVCAIRGIDPIDDFMLECALTVVNRLPLEQRYAALVPAWERCGKEIEEDAQEALRLKLRDVGALEAPWLKETLARHADPTFRRFAACELAQQKAPPKGVLAAALADSDAGVRGCAQAGLDAVDHPR